jgi:hypothetical protein
MSLQRKIIIGLADEQTGKRVAAVIDNITGDTNKLGFFGAAATSAQGVTLSNVTSVAQALINLGLATQNT